MDGKKVYVFYVDFGNVSVVVALYHTRLIHASDKELLRLNLYLIFLSVVNVCVERS